MSKQVKKFYRVEVTTIVYVLAESVDDANRVAIDARIVDFPTSEATEATRTGAISDGWEPGRSLVYHDGHDDVALFSGTT